MHNIKYICPRNCYNVLPRLLLFGGKELLFHEGTTQGDPTVMAIYGIVLTPLLKCLATVILKEILKW